MILELLMIILICVVLASVTYHRGMLDAGGSSTAFVMGIIIGIFGGIEWILLLLIFLASAFLATRYKFNYKKEHGFQEGKKGERGVVNVLANGIVPTLLAVFHNPGNSLNPVSFSVFPYKIVVFLFITSVACAASDTLASEMGILSDKTYLITNLKRVKPGINGGVSLYGEMWAFIGAAYTFGISFVVFYILEGMFIDTSLIIFGIFIGFMSCQIDSILGAVFERKGLIGKSTVNLIAVSVSILIAGAIIWLIKF
ncbi:MAG: DUF92 domain-containing protein [Thermoplasmatota archaeon]